MIDVIMAIGNSEIEQVVAESKVVHKYESTDDIELIEEILEYDYYDFIIVNSLLSVSKLAKLAGYIRDNFDEKRRPKIIALVKDFSDKKLIAHLVGLDVTAFVPLDQLHLFERYLLEYPDSFDLAALGSSSEKDKVSPALYKTVTGKIIIGVFSIANGAGATHTSLQLAEEIANCGYQVVCAEMDQDYYSFIDGKNKKIRYISVLDQNTEDLLHMHCGSAEYQFIIIDFGKIFEFDFDGNIVESKQDRLADFMRCNYKIGCCFSAPWQTDKLAVFLKNEFFRDAIYQNQLYLLISGDKADEAIEDYHELEMWTRDDFDVFKDKLMQTIGVLQKRKERKSFLKRRRG